MAPEVLKTFFESGIMGALLVVAGFYIWRMQKDFAVERKEWAAERVAAAKLLGDEKDARVEDAQNYAQMSLALQSRVLDATHKMADIYESWEQPRASDGGGSGYRDNTPSRRIAREEPDEATTKSMGVNDPKPLGGRRPR